MTNADLALNKAPPLWAPLRFFITAPLFGMAASLLLMWAGPDALVSRWTPALLSLTHLVTLGVLAMVMIGAMFQMVAVAAGSPAPRPRLLAGGLHLALVIGTGCLAAGLLGFDRRWLIAAAGLLGLGLGGFVAVAAYALLRAPRAHETVLGMALAVLSLAVALGLGLVLALGHAVDGIALHRFPLTDAHLGWGIAGWIGLLVVGIAFKVVPLFQVTPDYPGGMRRGWILLLLAGLTMWSAGDLLTAWLAPAWVWLQRVGGIVLLGAYGVFASVTLWLQARRRRRLPDVTTDFWRVGMVSILLGGVVWALAQWMPMAVAQYGYPLLLGSLLLGGFALSVINGMLYKIVPFLVWLHLQNQALSVTGGAALQVPNMKQIMSDRRARWQWRVHVAALLLLLGAVAFPAPLTHLAAAVFFTSFALLFRNLVGASLIYRYHRLRIARAAAQEARLPAAVHT